MIATYYTADGIVIDRGGVKSKGKKTIGTEVVGDGIVLSARRCEETMEPLNGEEVDTKSSIELGVGVADNV